MSDVFPASNLIPAKGYQRAKEIAYTQYLKAAERIALLSGEVSADTLWSWLTDLATALSQLNEIAAIPNIPAFAAEQEDDPELDIVAAFLRMTAAIDAAASWIYTSLPRDANGYLLTHKSTPEPALVARVFAPTATAPLAALLQDLRDAIG